MLKQFDDHQGQEETRNSDDKPMVDRLQEMRNKRKLDKQNTTKVRGAVAISDDFQSHLDQLNEVTSDILSRDTFLNKEEKDDTSELVPQGPSTPKKGGTTKNKPSESNTNLIDFSSWQEKMAKNSPQPSPEEEDELNNREDSTEEAKDDSSVNIRQVTQDGNTSFRKGPNTVTLKRKNIILKGEIKK